MMPNLQFFRKNLLLLVCAALGNLAVAQCSTTGAPTYSHTCSVEYYETISATGSGITSTINLTGGTCSGSTVYFNDFATQGIVAPGGAAITMHITRATGYAAYITVYVDWNNDGTYETTELAGTMVSMSSTTGTATYNFSVPTSGVATGTNLHMRMMLSELATGAPCTGNYGQAYDYYINVGTSSGCTPPVITFSPSSHDTICTGGTGVTIIASGAGTYSWAPSSGLSAATGSTVTANPTVTTVYTVTGTSTASCSATYYDTIVVISGGSLVDTIHSTGPDKFCLGGSVMLDGPAGAGYTYKWFRNTAAISGATSMTYYAIAAGSFTLELTTASGCTAISPAVSVTVYPLPVPVVTFVGKSLHTANYYTSYQWFENTTTIAGATADTVLPHSNGSYTVKVTDTNGCIAVSTIYTVTGLAVLNAVNTPGIEIYPNPATTTIHIESSVAVNAIITGIEGKVIARQSNAREMDISHLADGMYFIELFDETGRKLTVQRVIKKN